MGKIVNNPLTSTFSRQVGEYVTTVFNPSVEGSKVVVVAHDSLGKSCTLSSILSFNRNQVRMFKTVGEKINEVVFFLPSYFLMRFPWGKKEYPIRVTINS